VRETLRQDYGKRVSLKKVAQLLREKSAAPGLPIGVKFPESSGIGPGERKHGM
jgi:hypothetical protein